jgi:hypothetical protein
MAKKKLKLSECKSLDDIEDNELMADFINSKKFKKGFKKLVEKDTWDKGLPKYYMDKDGWLVEHWKDGTIIKKQDLKLDKKPNDNPKLD